MNEPAFPLPPAPHGVVDGHGRPACGAYIGHVEAVHWEGLAPPWARSSAWRALHAKRWHYVSIAAPRCVVGMAIVDLGWSATAFAYVFDREERILRADLSFLGLPRLSARVADRAGGGAHSSFRGPGVELVLARRTGSLEWRVRAHGPRGFRLDASLDAASTPPTLCAIAEPEGGVASCTHKTVCLPVQGTVAAGGARFDLAGAMAALDHTSGLLGRDTRWRWASAAGDRCGFNLVEGFNGAVENAIWVDGRLQKVGAAELRFDAETPLAPWTVRTVDGRVDLTFTPEGRRHEDRDLVVAASRYVQPIGTFRGTLRGDTEIKVDGLVGVTEDHHSRW